LAADETQGSAADETGETKGFAVNDTEAESVGLRGKRSDARRNIAAIQDAALTCLTRDPQASMAHIAQAAGVGRVTLYGHFGTRAELLHAVFARTLREAHQALSTVDLTGDARDALTRLVTASWRIIDQCRSLLHAAERELPAEHIRTMHDQPLRRVQELIQRGQRDGVFRTDLPALWLVAIFYNIVHGAAGEVTAGRLEVGDAAQMINAVLLAAYTPPGGTVPTNH